MSDPSNPKRRKPLPHPDALASGSDSTGQETNQSDNQKAAVQPTKSKLSTVELGRSTNDTPASQKPKPARRKKKRRSKITSFAPIDEVDSDSIDSTLIERLDRNRNPISSFMVSFVVHCLILILLAFCFYLGTPKPKGIAVSAEWSEAPELEAPKENNKTVEIELPEEIEQSPIEMDESDISKEEELLTPTLTENNDPSESENTNPIPSDAKPEVAKSNLPTGGGIGGRNADSRARIAGTKGGSPASEDAVEMGLRWLAAHQRSDGSWRLNLKDCPCKGKCRNSGTRESATAATGLALLAYLGAGYTPDEGKYQEEVRKGLDYLVNNIKYSKFGGSLAEPTMYSHGIATLALSEAYAMTKDSQYGSAAASGIKYIVSAQHKHGGWRYNPQSPGDMTVTGWQIMALKSAALSDLTVPEDVWPKVSEFLDSKQKNYGATYGYLTPGEEPTPTAVGLLSRMYLGMGRDNVGLNEGAQRISEWGPSKTDIYFDYYATLVMHHMRNENWDSWNEEMREYLIATQRRTGHETGSWFFKNEHGAVGGRLYTTAMAIMILEVYYRYLPLYEQDAFQ